MDRFSVLRWGRGRIKLAFKCHTAVLSDFAGRVVATVSLISPDRWRSMQVLLDEIAELMARVVEKGGRSMTDIDAVLPHTNAAITK